MMKVMFPSLPQGRVSNPGPMRKPPREPYLPSGYPVSQLLSTYTPAHRPLYLLQDNPSVVTVPRHARHGAEADVLVVVFGGVKQVPGKLPLEELPIVRVVPGNHDAISSPRPDQRIVGVEIAAPASIAISQQHRQARHGAAVSTGKLHELHPIQAVVRMQILPLVEVHHKVILSHVSPLPKRAVVAAPAPLRA